MSFIAGRDTHAVSLVEVRGSLLPVEALPPGADNRCSAPYSTMWSEIALVCFYSVPTTRDKCAARVKSIQCFSSLYQN